MTDCPTKPLAIFAAISVIALFVAHPAVNSYHTGFAAAIVIAVFIAATFAGSIVRPRHLVAVLFVLAFIEPHVQITRSLSFQIVFNGLLLGASLRLIIDRYRPGVIEALVMLPLVALAVLVSAGPVINDATNGAVWFGAYQGLLLLRFPVLLALGILAARDGFNLAWLAASLVVAGAFLSVMGLAEIVDNDAYKRVQVIVYQMDELKDYRRLRGTAQAIKFGHAITITLAGSAIALLPGIPLRVRLFAIAIFPLTMLIILGTGSRLAMVVTVVMFVVFMASVRRWRLRRLSVKEWALLMAAVACTSVLASASEPAGQTFDMSLKRTVGIKANDESMRGRLSEYTAVAVASTFGDPGTTEGRSSEVLSVLARLGIVGVVFIVWVFTTLGAVAWRRRDHAPALILILAGSAVALHGTPVIFSSFSLPILALVAGVTIAYSPARHA